MAWVHQVVNPWIVCLAGEEAFLVHDNLTFRPVSGELEFIKPLREYLPSVNWPTMENLAEAHPSVEAIAKTHDDTRLRLLSSAKKAFEWLMADGAFLASVEEAIATRPGHTERSGAQRSVAERVVNCITTVGTHYVDADLYNPHAQLFLAFRRGACFEDLSNGVQALRAVIAEAVAVLKKLRSQLVEEYDIPPSPFSYGSPQT